MILLITVVTLIVGVLTLIGTGGIAVGAGCACLLIFILPAAAFAITNPTGVRFGERLAITVAIGMTIVALGTVVLAAVGLRLD